ncbi:MAG: YicC family protein [Gemmatimonadetes bacterium]|nr:YicC family protein [Gemmatimonadota bacterium]
MIRSMTGFGEAERGTAAGRLRVELRTVNHRFLNINTRLPSALTRWEPELREWLRGSLSRGHVNCTLRLEPESGPEANPVGYRLDEQRAAAYLAVFRELSDRFNLPGTPDLQLLSRFNDIIVRDEEEAELPLEAEELRAVVEAAAQQNVRFREEEGRRLQVDLEERIAAIAGSLDQIQQWAPERLVTERDRLRQAIRELSETPAVDEQRLAQEIAYLAERWDINEELVRFRAHLDLFRDLLAADAAEPVGKRLAFLVQEMHREANTLGSKANDARIAHGVVAIKDEIERLREQVENVE